jgi:hypothetical protein
MVNAGELPSLINLRHLAFRHSRMGAGLQFTGIEWFTGPPSNIAARRSRLAPLRELQNIETPRVCRSLPTFLYCHVVG